MAKGALGEGTAFASRKQAAMRCVPRADAVALGAARVGQYKSVIPKREAFVSKNPLNKRSRYKKQKPQHRKNLLPTNESRF